MGKPLFLFFILFCSLVPGLRAQDAGILKGRVTALDERVLGGAHIINLRLRTGTTSNDSGYFSIQAGQGDSLLLTYIGFTPRIVEITWPVTPDTTHFYLVETPTELKGVTVYALPPDFLSFKRAFINLKLPADSAVVFHIPPLEFYGNLPESGGFGITVAGPLQALYNAYSKEGRQKAKMKQLLAGERMEALREKRYNRQVITMLTGLTDAESIQRFMEYCQISNTQLLTLNDYDLYLAILDCFQSFDRNN